MKTPEFTWSTTGTAQIEVVKEQYPNYTIGSKFLSFQGDKNQAEVVFDALTFSLQGLRNLPGGRIITYNVDPRLKYMNLFSWNSDDEDTLLMLHTVDYPPEEDDILGFSVRLEMILGWHTALSTAQQESIQDQFLNTTNLHLLKARLPTIPLTRITP